MGMCQCNDRQHHDNGQLVVRSKIQEDQENGYETNFETQMNLKSRAGNTARRQEEDFQFVENGTVGVQQETPREEPEKKVEEPKVEAKAEEPTPNIVVEETPEKEEIPQKSKANNTKNLKIEVDIEQNGEIPLPSPSLGRYNSYVPARLDTTEGLDYYDISNEIFRLYNDVRVNPQDYESTVDLKFRNILRQLSEENVDNILWSQKFYDIAFDYFNSLTDRKASTEEINSALLEKINEQSDETYSLYTISDIAKTENVEKVLWNLLNNNSSEVRNVLLKNYHVGFVCNIPVNPKQDRTLLCLATRRDD